MGSWIAQNFGMVAWSLALLVGGATGWAVLRSRVTRLEERDRDRDDEIQTLQDSIKDVGEEIANHRRDTTLHIDPQRDQRMQDELKGEMRAGFERVEKKIERLLVYTPPPGS